MQPLGHPIPVTTRVELDCDPHFNQVVTKNANEWGLHPGVSRRVDPRTLASLLAFCLAGEAAVNRVLPPTLTENWRSSP